MKNIDHSAIEVRLKLGWRYVTKPTTNTTRIAEAIAAKMLAPSIMFFSTSSRDTIDVPMRLPPHAGPGGGSCRNLSVTQGMVIPMVWQCSSGPPGTPA